MPVPELFSFHMGNILSIICVINLYFVAVIASKDVDVEIEFHIFTCDIVLRLPQLYDTRAEGAHMVSFDTAHVREPLYFLTPSNVQ